MNESEFNEQIIKYNRIICDILNIEDFTNLLETDNGIETILSAFYQSKPFGLYTLSINSCSNFTVINIQHTVFKTSVVHTTHDDFKTALLIAVGSFFESLDEDVHSYTI